MIFEEKSMPPKTKITKKDIINTSVDLVRSNGKDSINARSIASALNCSTQPIFSNFSSMEELDEAIIKASYEIYISFIKNEVASGKYPKYKSFGMAYIRFAKEEKELFKLLYMRTRKEDDYNEDSELFDQRTALVEESTGLAKENTSLCHLEMWAYVHGIATMFATGFLSLDWEIVSKTITDVYQGLKKQYGIEE